jgi:3',5'-cyclic AMP phosphodiesterase CpdA
MAFSACDDRGDPRGREVSSQFGAPQTFRQIRDAAASANVLGEKVTVEAAKALAESFGEATYDYATQTWHWDESTYRVLHLTDGGGDPYELIFSRMLPDDRDRIATELQAFVALQQEIAESAALASQLGLASLTAEVSCAQDSFEIEMGNMNAGLGPLAELLGVINALLGLAGLKAISVDLSSSASPTEAIEAMLKIADTIDQAASAVPL